MQKKEMFRYNHSSSTLKDTLFTFREGNLIFYGISRCNLKTGDKFNKELGKKIAIGRAIEAKRLFEENEAVTFDDSSTQANRMGVVSVEEIKSLLGYFDGLVCRSK